MMTVLQVNSEQNWLRLYTFTIIPGYPKHPTKLAEAIYIYNNPWVPQTPRRSVDKEENYEGLIIDRVVSGIHFTIRLHGL